MIKKARLIGLTGTNCAGKGEAASFFQKAGYAFLSLSDLIRDEIRKKDLPLSRDNLIITGNELRENHGADILARRIMTKVRGNTIIDSIRNPKEVEFLQSQPDFILLAIDAPVKIRYERAKQRGRNESVETLEEFISKEEEEMSNYEKGQQLHKCMEMADHKIQNDSTLEAFYNKLEKFL
jgi:dephospho-CoA kinase